ncbi:MAG: stage sporulation protein [Firmicutes bacterium]|nr:stage sporulation protein [Bacillota bacterium]
MLLIHLMVATVMLSGIYAYLLNATVPVVAMRSTNTVFMGLASWRDFLFWGIPGLAHANELKANQTVTVQRTMRDWLNETLILFTNINGEDLSSILRAELPRVAKNNLASTPAITKAKVPAFNVAKNLGKPVVAVYHTHTAESFIPSSGVAHSPGGQIGEIAEVGDALIQALAKQGISGVQDTTIHDYPSFMKAYGASEVTVKKLLQEQPSLQMIFDIHRDADKRENVIATVNGETVAKISIIVAQGQADLPQPHWKENYALAKLIDEKCNEKYPGLSRGIQLVEWRYNQHLHPHALLLEVGSHETSKAEAMRSMEMLGDVIVEILQGND